MTNVPIDSLRLHPDSERVPMATPPDLDALRDSLREHGQQDPIDITPDGLVLDGRTRWTLLRDLGAQSIQVREVVIPDRDQTHYIVDRALSRRHLTADQKRALNALLAEVVMEVLIHPKTGEEMRIGKSRTQRASDLGVDVRTIENWDTADTKTFVSDPPTHIRLSTGRVQPAHTPTRTARSSREPLVRKASPGSVRPTRNAPPWRRYFTQWCRAVLPEDGKYLAEMSEELHRALDLLGMECKQGVND